MRDRCFNGCNARGQIIILQKVETKWAQKFSTSLSNVLKVRQLLN